MSIIGTEIDKRYKLIRPCGENGATGTVYYAERIGTMHGAARAIKLIKNSNLKPTWDKEIEKARLIGYRDFPVPMYEDYGDVTIDGISYKWIASEWIDGISVKKLINDRRMTIPILLSVIENSLKVFFAANKLEFNMVIFIQEILLFKNLVKYP